MVTTPDPVWGQTARSEMPTLEQSLDALGYEVNDTEVSIGQPEIAGGLPVRRSNNAGMLSVDLEV